jgi:hypothetical protein
LGLNFNWHVTPADRDVARLSRELFFLPNRAIYREFDTADAQFGGYLSKNLLGFRLKMDVKPITVLTEQGQQERIQFLFNFHADITPNETAARMIDELLHQWRAAGNHSHRMIETVDDGGAA